MILVDSNLLVYAFAEQLAQHDAARTWLDGRLNDTPAVGLPWPSLLAFVRLVSNPRVFSRPAPIDGAWRQVRDWLARQSVWIPAPTNNHAEVLESLLVGVRANDVPDAHLAALAIEHGLVLCTSDRGFSRFAKLRWHDPLTGNSRE